MTAEQELMGYGFYLRKNRGGALRLYTVYGIADQNGQLQPGDYVETQLACDSPLAGLVECAFAEQESKHA